MAARIDCSDVGSDSGSNLFPARYQKAKNERGYKATRTASLDSSETLTGRLCEQTVLVDTKSCCEIPMRGECYGKGILDDGVSKSVEEGNLSYKENSEQRPVKIETVVDGTSLSDVAKLNEQLQFLKSCIHLSLEEAFYLVHCKQSLKVYVKNKDNLLSVEDFWKQCCKRVKNFVDKYVVYQYYRNKGWVPKPGTKFGVHFLLYKDGPNYFHSGYGVLVRSVVCASELTWQFVISFVRAMESVNKGAIMCDVKPVKKDVDLSTPSCISYFTVEETLINRWVPKQDRN